METQSAMRGRTALVVGGTGGIGKAVARELARLGAGIILHGGHDSEKCADVAGELESYGVPVQCIVRAVDSMDDAETLAAAASAADILVCAFGPYMRSSLADMHAEDWRRMTELNLALPGYLASCALRHMAESGYGRIVFFGGTGTDTVRGYTAVAAYSAAKSGLGVLAKSIARSYASKNIACNVVTPGLVDTEYITEVDRAAWTVRSRTGWLLRPEQIGRYVASMIGDEDGIINGAIIDLSAGMI